MEAVKKKSKSKLVHKNRTALVQCQVGEEAIDVLNDKLPSSSEISNIASLSNQASAHQESLLHASKDIVECVHPVTKAVPTTESVKSIPLGHETYEHESKKSPEIVCFSAPKCLEATDTKENLILYNNEIKDCDKNVIAVESAMTSSVEQDLSRLTVRNDESRNVLLKKKIYPDIERIEQFKAIDGISSSQTLVKTYVENFVRVMIKEVNQGVQYFYQELYCVEENPLFNMLHQYESARKFSSIELAKLKSLNAQFKRKKDSLWVTVAKSISAQGYCQDGSKVCVSHKYNIKELDKNVFQEVKETLSEIEKSCISNFVLYTFVENENKFRIIQLFHELIKGVEIIQSSISDSTTKSKLSNQNFYCLKKSISILFSFQRKSTYDKDFFQATQLWLTILVPVLLKNGMLEDNMFIVNHVLRCPHGIHTWATQFVQLPLPESEKGFECRNLHYIIAVLYMILSPVPEREHFLRNIKYLKMSAESESFILLDSDGEEEQESMFEVVREWSEEDVLSLLNQIPFAELFKHVLLATSNGKDEDKSILKLLAFCSTLVDIFITGLETYSDEMYNQLMEMLCNLVRHTTKYVSNLWKNFMVTAASFSPGLQAEFDRFIFHVVYKIYSFRKFKVWKFLATLPFTLVSTKMLWSLLWIFHSPNAPEDVIYSEKDVETKLLGETVRMEFLAKLSAIDQQDAVYLLNAFEKIGIMRSKETDLMCFIAQEIFEITFVHEELRTYLCKEGRILIASLAQENSSLISLLVKDINKRDLDTADCSQMLFNEINFMNWTPESEDLKIISEWLLSEVLSSPKSRLARTILKKMNWSCNKKSLCLPLDLHKKVAILVLSAYMKFDSDGNTWPVSRGLTQMLQLFSPIISSRKNEDSGFVAWAWNLIFSLKLHTLDEPNPPWVQIYDGYVPTNEIVDMHLDPSLDSLKRAFEEKHPMGLYLAPIMTKIGYSVTLLADVGLTSLSALVESEQYAAAIQLLFYTLPFFVKHAELLLSNELFISSICDLIVADKTWLSFTSGVVVGTVLHNLAAMMKYQIEQACDFCIEIARPLLKLWLQILFHVLAYGESRNYKRKIRNKFINASMQVCFLLDILVKISFINPHTRDSLLDQMDLFSRPFLLAKSVQSSWSGSFDDKVTLFSFINQTTLSEYPWLAFFILLSETKQKSSDDLWHLLLKEIGRVEPITPDIFLKITSTLYKTNNSPLEFLPIYQWAYQVAHSSVSHPIFVLFCQQFFLRYLQRIPTSSTSKSIGAEFFKSRHCLALFEKVKKSLGEAEAHYANALEKSATQYEGIQNDSVNESAEKDKLKLLNSLFLTFRAFSVWINEANLHSSGLCLSALEPRFNVEKLTLILNNDQRYWFELISVENIKNELNKEIRPWHQKQAFGSSKKMLAHYNPTFGSEDITKLLSNYDEVTPLSVSEELKPPISETFNNSTLTWNNIDATVQQVQQVVYKSAKNFTDLLQKVKQLNFTYINWIPQEYAIEDIEISLKNTCSKGSEGTNCCAGPAVFNLRIQKCTAREEIRLLSQNNRIEYNLVLDQIRNLPLEELCFASVLMEKCVRDLIEKSRLAMGTDKEKLNKVGVSLFYLLMKVFDEVDCSVASYSPSKQFFTPSLEVLGKEFIEGREKQCLPLVKALLKYPSVGPLASRIFKPDCSSPVDFVTVYESLAQSVDVCSPHSILLLLNQFDLQSWFNDERVTFTHRKLMFQKISDALCHCGTNPDEGLLLIYQIYKKHFCAALLCMFPEHFSDAVQMLLNGIKTNSLCVDIWYEAFRCFGCHPLSEQSECQEIKQIIKKFANNQLLPPEEQLFVSNQPLNFLQVLETLELFYNTIMEIRLSSSKLYTKCKLYTKVVGIFLSMMSHSLVALFLKEKKTLTQDFSVQHLWNFIEKAFYPWIYPIEKDVCLKFPWTHDEEDQALVVFQMFGICLEYLHEKLSDLDNESNVLSHVWCYYIETYVIHGFRNYSVKVCHTAFACLPWHEFYPCADDIEGMCKILQSDIPESRSFLSEISLKIPWLDVMTKISETRSTEYIAKTLATLGKLLIISEWKISVVKTNSHQNNFKAVESLQWEFLTLSDVEELLALYYSVSDPLKVALKQTENNPDVNVFRFLKHVCCMTPQNLAQQNPYSNQKRLLFIRNYVTLISTYMSKKKDFDPKELKNILTIVPGLLNDIELIVSQDVSPDQQINIALPLVREVFAFFNDLSDTSLRNQVVEPVVDWLRQHTGSPLLLPCLKIASDSTDSVDNLSIVECCIATRFNTELQDPSEAIRTWHLISSFFQVSLIEATKFMIVCSELNAHLSLYLYILHRIPVSSTVESKGNLLQDIIDYTTKTELKENCESGMILLWDKILELCISLASENELQMVASRLSSFCSCLTLFGEDRSRKGILAAIGFGSYSQLSVNFRFLSRAMVAFLYAQLPENGLVRLEMMAPGYMTSNDAGDVTKTRSRSSTPSLKALRALDALKELYNNKTYGAIRSQIDIAIKFVMNPKLCLLDSRELLRDLALYLFPNKQYLHAIGK